MENIGCRASTVLPLVEPAASAYRYCPLSQFVESI